MGFLFEEEIDGLLCEILHVPLQPIFLYLEETFDVV